MVKELMRLIAFAVLFIGLGQNGRMYAKARSVRKTNNGTMMKALPSITENYQSCTKSTYESEYPCGGDGYIYIDEFKVCLKYYIEQKSWLDAEREYCNHEGGSLVTVTSLSMEKAMYKRAPSEVSGGEYWIGLNKINHPDFSWAMYPDYKPPSFTHWKPGEPTNSDAQKCVITNYKGAYDWDDHYCSRHKRFVCERFSEIALVEEGYQRFAPEAELRISSRVVIVDCAAYIDDGGKIYFKYNSETGWKQGWPDDSRVTEKEGMTNPVYILEDYDRFPSYTVQKSTRRCRRRFRSEIRLPFIAEMHQERLTCCSKWSTGQVRCTSTSKVTITFERQKPLLDVKDHVSKSQLQPQNDSDNDKKKIMKENVVYVSKRIVFTCGAFVGSNSSGPFNGYLAMSYKQVRQETVSVTYKKINADNSLSTDNFPQHVKFDHWTKTFSTLGPYIQSYISVYLIPGLQQVQVNCTTQFTSSYDFTKYDPRYTVNSEAYLVYYYSLTPDLEISVHGEPAPTSSGVVNLNVSQHFVSTCSGYVGTEGGLMWRVQTNCPERQIHEWTYNQEGKTDNNKTVPPFVRAENISVSVQLEKGPFIVTTLNITASYLFDGGRITCLTHNSEGYRAVTSDLPEYNTSPTFTLSVRYIPLRPRLTSGFEKAAIVTGGKGRVLKVHCTAFIGQNGFLSFAVITHDTILIWRVNATGGVVNTPFGSGGGFSASSDKLSLAFGPRINVTFAVEETGDNLDGFVFACYSYSVPDIADWTTPHEEEWNDGLLDTTVIDYYGKEASSGTALSFSEGALTIMVKWCAGILTILSIVLGVIILKRRTDVWIGPVENGEGSIQRSLEESYAADNGENEEDGDGEGSGGSLASTVASEGSNVSEISEVSSDSGSSHGH